MQKSTKISLLLLGPSLVSATYLTPKFNTLVLTSKILDIALLITAAVCLIFLVFKSTQELYKNKRQEERKSATEESPLQSAKKLNKSKRQEERKKRNNTKSAPKERTLESPKKLNKSKRQEERKSATEESPLQSAQESYKNKRQEERKERKKRIKIADYAKAIQGNLQLLEEDKNILKELKSFKIKEFYHEMAEAILCDFKSSITQRKVIIDSHNKNEEENTSKDNYERDFERGIKQLLQEKFNEEGLFKGIKNGKNSPAVMQFTQGEMSLQCELDLVLMANRDAIYQSRSVNFNILGVLNPNGVLRYTQLTTNILTMLFYHKGEETRAFINQNLGVLTSKGLSAFYFICASKDLYLGSQGRAMSYGIVEKSNLDLTNELNKYKELKEEQAAGVQPADIMKKHLTCELNIWSILNKNS